MEISVLQYLEEAEQRFPDKIALSDDTEEITYADYCRRAKVIGTFLHKAVGGKTGRPVAVLIDRNIRSIVAFLGVVYSGNFYVPIDTSMPEERIRLIYDTLEPIFVIDARNEEKEAAGSDRDAFTHILGSATADEQALQKIRKNHIDTDPLYAIFTSGSTGVPKGVLISHRSVIDMVNAFAQAFGFTEDQVFGNQAPFDFDVSVKDIYNALHAGGTIRVLPKRLFMTPKLLVQYLQEKEIDTMIWAVSALRIVSDFKALEEVSLSLKNVMFSGEVMPVKSLNYWRAHVPDARYVNLYGPTEITCNCTYYVIDPTRVYEEDQMLPIGKAFQNCRVFLRDEKGDRISKPEEIGEICVEGTCLALGYWNNREKTAEAFVDNKDVPQYSSRIYKTGDMGYYNEDGDIVFASRRDHQIKHMGHRIELGEIEASLNAIPFLTIAVCIYDAKKEKIVCHYQADEECKKEIVLALSKKLPKYMWPNVYVKHDALPLNKNGKIDRKALQKSYEESN